MSPSLPASGPRLKALVVEDSFHMRELLTRAIAGVTGLEVVGAAETVTDALVAFETHRPDIVILDLALRAGSGLDVLREIKLRMAACRVLVFTGHDQPSYRQYCLGAGADYFFSKNREQEEMIRQLHAFTSDVSKPTASADVSPPSTGGSHV